MYRKIGRYLLISIFISSCVNYRYVTKDVVSEIVNPEWFKCCSEPPKVLAIFPFEGYDMRSRSIARKIESGLRSKLLQWGQYRIIEREHIDKIFREQALSLSGATEEQVVEVGKMLGTRIIVLGGVTDYSEEEIYLDYVEGTYYASEKYKRKVYLSLNMRVIDVQNAEILWEEEKGFEAESIGYKNVHRIKEGPEITGESWDEDLIKALIAGTIEGIAKAMVDGKMPSFACLRNKCVSAAIDYFFWKLVSYREKFRHTYIIYDTGKAKLLNKEWMGRIPP